MPYNKEHKLGTRKRIIESARKLFNQRGFSEVTIDEIMQDAGLTRGGFYNHFKAKDELFIEAIKAFGNCDLTERWNDVELDFTNDEATIMRQMISAYLSHGHLESLDEHCPLIALSSDISRESEKVKHAYKQAIQDMAKLFEKGLSSNSNQRARSRALGLVSLCIGGMVIARTLNEPELANEVRLAAHDLALISAELQ